MAQFVKEVLGLPIAAIRAYLDSCSQPLEVSALYETATNNKIIDPELRLSRFRAIKDKALFGLARCGRIWVSASQAVHTGSVQRAMRPK